MAQLAQLGQQQRQFGLQLGGAELDQANLLRNLRLLQLQSFLENFRLGRREKKQAERAKTAQRQQQAMSAGSILAALTLPGAATGLAGLFGDGGGGNLPFATATGTGGIDDILTRLISGPQFGQRRTQSMGMR